MLLVMPFLPDSPFSLTSALTLEPRPLWSSAPNNIPWHLFSHHSSSFKILFSSIPPQPPFLDCKVSLTFVVPLIFLRFLSGQALRHFTSIKASEFLRHQTSFPVPTLLPISPPWATLLVLLGSNMLYIVHHLRCKGGIPEAAGFALLHPVALHFIRPWMSRGSTFSRRMSADSVVLVVGDPDTQNVR